MLFPEGDCFEFDTDPDDAPPRPVVAPDESNPGYRENTPRYRAACRAIAGRQSDTPRTAGTCYRCGSVVSDAAGWVTCPDCGSWEVYPHEDYALLGIRPPR
jgi:hypothetical protein